MTDPAPEGLSAREAAEARELAAFHESVLISQDLLRALLRAATLPESTVPAADVERAVDSIVERYGGALDALGGDGLREAVLAAIRNVPSDYPDVVPRSDAVMAVEDVFAATLPESTVPAAAEQILIRATHPAGFRAGEWATLTGIQWANNRPCYTVRFIDGATDSWVCYDPSDPYEFRAAATPPASPSETETPRFSITLADGTKLPPSETER